MTSTHRLLFPLSLLALSAACLLAPSARAALLPTYDMDSLVALSSDIVVARLGKEHLMGPSKMVMLPTVDATIEQAWHGTLRAGQHVSAWVLDSYASPDSARRDRQHSEIGAGDRAVLFLSRRRPDWLSKPPRGVQLFQAIGSGVRLLAGGKVYAFRQINNPGGYEPFAMRAGDKPNAGLLLTEAGLLKMVHESQDRVHRWMALFAKPPQREDAAWLLPLLRQRASQGTLGEERPQQADEITARACLRLAKIGDAGLLAEALDVLLDHQSRSILQNALSTPTGRELMLSRIADSRQPLARRLALAEALRYGGLVYHQSTIQSEAGSSIITGQAKQGNGRFLSRIAALAASNTGNAPLSEALLESLASMTQVLEQGAGAEKELASDRRGMVDALSRFYRASKSQQQLFDIEIILVQSDRAAFKRLGSPCGPILSILKRPSQDYAGSPDEAGRSLSFDYQMEVFTDAPKSPKAEVSLLHLLSGRRFTLPVSGVSSSFSDGNFSSGFSSNGGCTVSIPKSLPHGRYRIALQFKSGGKVVSRGHTLEAEL